jgi:hypothetical protein
MNRVGSITPPGELSESQKAALLTLLADDDPNIYHNIRQKIISFGPSASEWLRPHTLSRSRLCAAEPRRSSYLSTGRRRIIRFWASVSNTAKRLTWRRAPGNWLALNILISMSPAMKLYWTASRRTCMRRSPIAANPRGFWAPSIINLFDELGFVGNEEQQYEPDNSYLNRILDRRTGSPIGLCLVYLLLARRLHLPVTGIGLPGHFVCRYQSSSAEIYVDPLIMENC